MPNIWGLQRKAKNITKLLKKEQDKGKDSCYQKITRLFNARKNITRSIEKARENKLKSRRKK